MNFRLALFFTVAASFASSGLHAADAEFPLKMKPEELHALIREVAAKMEEKYKGQRPEADGLVQRVEEMLAAPEPPEVDEADRPRMLAKQMVLMNGEFYFQAVVNGVRGPVFDSSETGYMQRYQDLESASTRDAEEVWRWLDMAEAARKLKWKDKEEMCSQRALGAARALVDREPKNAEAHALLGMALEWSSEKLAELQTALKLDPRQTLALLELIQRREHQALDNAVLGQATAMEQKPLSDVAVAQALYERTPADENRAAYERQLPEVRHDLDRVLALAEEQGNLVTYLRTAYSLKELGFHQETLAAAARREPQESYEGFFARVKSLALDNSLTVFADDSVLRTALKLAADDPEATGTVILMALMGDITKQAKSQQRPTEPRMLLLRETFARLLEMAGSGESLRAARACEGVFLTELFLVALLQREPTHAELLARAVHLDPFCQRTQGLVAGMCLGAPRKNHVRTAGAALALTELALLPGLQTRRMCAVAACLMNDWPAAHRHLDACLKENPEDLALLIQKAVTFLKESQSAAAQKKAALYFSKIESLREKPEFKPSKGDLNLIASNHILFLMLGGKNDAARKELTAAQRDKLLDENECKELEKLLP